VLTLPASLLILSLQSVVNNATLHTSLPGTERVENVIDVQLATRFGIKVPAAKSDQKHEQAVAGSPLQT
jgi:hypothetical protein